MGHLEDRNKLLSVLMCLFGVSEMCSGWGDKRIENWLFGLRTESCYKWIFDKEEDEEHHVDKGMTLE